MTATGQTAATSALLEQLREKARLLRIHSIRMTTAAGSGHPTSCLSAAELVAATFFYAMKMDPANPTSLASDRFVLSKGHAAPILYAALAEKGVFPVSRLMTLRQFSSELEGHPTPRVPGVDAATGSLGQGLSVGAGLAIGARVGKSSARVYVLTGDGELAEGNIWEAAAFAGHYGLDNLVVLADINALGQSQPTMYKHDMEVYRRKFEAQGWAAEVIDGHDLAAVVGALDHARATRGRPFAIIARTDKGHGVSFVSGKEGWHGKAFSPEQMEKALAELGPIPPVQKDPGKSYERKPLPVPPEDFPAAAAPEYKLGESVATREAFGVGLKNLAQVNPKVYAIDGDVENSTFVETLQKAFPDRVIEGYIAEQNMVSVGVGMAAQGLVPYVATFACFLSRAYDQVRMAGISRSSIKLCGSHCGISIGEDGPSQMALEDLAIFRAIPGATDLIPERRRFRGTLDRGDGPAGGDLLLANVTAEDRGALRQGRKISGAGSEGVAPERERPGHSDWRGGDGIRSAEGMRPAQVARYRHSRARSLFDQTSGQRGAGRARSRHGRQTRHGRGSLSGRRFGRSCSYGAGGGWRGAKGGKASGRRSRAAFGKTGGVAGRLRHLGSQHCSSGGRYRRRDNRSGLIQAN